MGVFEFYERILFPALNKGLWLSVKIIVPSAVFGVIIGVLAGAGRAAGPAWLKKLLDLYVAVFRGTPLVVQLFMWYWGIPSAALFMESAPGLAGSLEPLWRAVIMIKPYPIAVLAFTLCSGAYQSEYIRGALLSVRRGQHLAAESLGMSKLQTFRHITAPIALRRALPGCGNEIVYLVKYSSLAVLITLQELTGMARNVASLYFRHLESYMLLAAYYLVLVTMATWLLRLLERKLAIPGLGRV
jgi:polar amino acid transport system permease protein